MDGTSPRGNGLQGIMLYNASNNYLQPGTVSYNGAAGVAVVGDTATGNAIFFYSAHSNAGLPIDLGNDGASPNGSHAPPGPNNWQGYPVVTGSSGSPVMLTGSTCANCRVLIFQAIGNPAANGGGGDRLKPGDRRWIRQLAGSSAGRTGSTRCQPGDLKSPHDCLN